jgi:hypothetical protein
MVLEHGSAGPHILGALVFVHLTMVTAHFPDDVVCQRKRGGGQQRLCSFVTAAAAPHLFMI